MPADTPTPSSNVAFASMPPPVFASAVDLPKPPADALDPDFLIRWKDQQIPFWRPTVSYLLGAIGWRWVFMAPALFVLVGLPIFFALHPGAARYLGCHTLFVWGFALAVGITLIEAAIQRGVRARHEPFCIHCGYSVEGLGESGQCPECGRFFIRPLIDEFRKDPQFFAHRVRKALSHPPSEPFPAGEGPTPDDGTR